MGFVGDGEEQFDSYVEYARFKMKRMTDKETHDKITKVGSAFRKIFKDPKAEDYRRWCKMRKIKETQ